MKNISPSLLSIIIGHTIITITIGYLTRPAYAFIAVGIGLILGPILRQAHRNCF